MTTEAALLKTDKADVSVELQPKAITDMPLNQYRNYQALINLVPGATPGAFQNSAGSTPQRSLRTFVNGTNPNNNSTRIDGAASINIWLPHHAGMVASAETIDNVNIVTNNFDADTGMAGGAAIAVVTKSGTNNLRGLGVPVPQPRRVERQHVLQQRQPAEQAAGHQLDLRRHDRRARS